MQIQQGCMNNRRNKKANKKRFLQHMKKAFKAAGKKAFKVPLVFEILVFNLQKKVTISSIHSCVIL